MRASRLTDASLSERLSSLEPADVHAAQISQLFADSRVNLLVSFLGGLLFASLMWGAVPSYWLVIWLAAHWTLLAIRYALAWRFRNRSPSGEAVLRWGQWLRASATIAGLWWGLSGILLFPTDSVPHQFILALVLGGAALAHVRMHAVVLECSALPSILILLPLSARLVYEGKQTDLLAALAVFAVGLVVLAYRMNKSIAESFKLSFEKNSLINDLESEIAVRQSAEQELREARDHLEKRVEERTEALRESEQRFRALAEAAPFGIMLIKEGGAFRYINPRFRELFGYTLEDAPNGREWFRRAYPDSEYRRHVISTWIEEAKRAKTGQFRPKVFTVKRRDGSETSVNFIAERLPSGEHMVTCEDISERLRAEELSIQTERLKAISDLAGGVAHNFNNLLQMVMGGIDLALVDLEMENLSDLKKTLEQLLEASKLGATTVKRLQSFAQVRSEAQFPEGELFDLAETVKQTAEMTMPLWKTGPERQGVRMALNLELTERCFVKAKESEIAEVLVNLVKNAAEALPTGGEVRIKTFLRGEQVMLQVSDDGVGIKREDLKKVFEPFWSTKGVTIGTGMGLAVSHGLMARNGGILSVESEEGKGATFTATLPLAKDSQEVPMPSGPKMFLPRLKILVIDDIAVIVMHLEAILTKHRQKVFSATSGKEALEIFRNNNIDMVICDLSMPSMNGWEVSKAIRAICRERGLPKTPFVLLTGWGGQQLEQDKITESAVDAIVEKPIDSKKLMAVVGEMAERILPGKSQLVGF